MQANKLEIGLPQVPKFRRVSRRLDDGGSAATQFSTPEDYYRKQYFELIDTAVAAVTRRFDQPGMELACAMESIIVKAAQGCTIGVDDDQFQAVVTFYHEFDNERLLCQLASLQVCISTHEPDFHEFLFSFCNNSHLFK